MPLESSPEPKVEGGTPETAAEGKPEATDVKAPAESSPADPAKAKVEAKGEKSMLDAVKAALKPKTQEEAPASEPAPKSAAEPGESAKEGDPSGEKSDDLSPEELAQLKPKTKKRINDLLAERSDRDKKIADLEPKAVQFERIVTFVRDAGLSSGEVNDLFDIGKNLKTDPRKAYERIKPVYEQLQQMFGDVLPKDLQEQVARGLLTPAHAKELASTRTNAAVAENRATQLAERDRQRQAGEANQAHVNEVRSSVSRWEADQEKTDPDWKLKQPHVMRAAKAALLELGHPPTPAESVEIAKKALAEVNNDFKDLVPRKREIRPVVNAAATPSTAKPTSMLEAARQGLAKARTA